MNTKRKNAIFLLMVFLLSIWLPLIFSDKQGGKVSVNEKRTLAKFPNLTSISGLRSGLENWINDNAGFREPLSKLNAVISYDIFHTSTTDRVQVGKDGWFFYAWDNNLEIAKGTYPLTQDLLEKIKSNQERIQRALAKKGIEYVLVLTPSKVSIYPEEIGGSNFSVMKTPVDIVADYLQKNTTVKVINLKPALLAAKNQTVFFKTDTHWNQVGAYIGYKTMMQKLNQFGLMDTPAVSVQIVPGTYKGEYSAMMGNRFLLPPEEIFTTNIIDPHAYKVSKTDLRTLISKEQAGHHLDVGGSGSFHDPAVKDEKVLMYGDSFFGSWNVEQLFAENCSDLDFVWSDYIKNSIVEKVKPKLVIYERTERYINTLAEDCDPRLSTQPLKNANASLTVSQSKIDRNDHSSLTVTVKNTSSSNFTEDGWIRLCILPDGEDHSYRINIPDNMDIKPGEQYTFTANDMDKYTDDANSLTFQMVEEGVQYFGNRVTVQIAD